MANPFGTLNDDPTNSSHSPDASYLRPNIAVPTITYAKSAAQVALDADTVIEDKLPSGATVGSLPTPASVAA